MYPFVRMFKEVALTRGAEPLSLYGTHVSRHVCWPWDLDFWMELNNGRTLTLFDLGRIPFARRLGLIGALQREGWGLTVAGVSVRYRRRITMFQRFEMRTRLAGWDERFFYIDQSLWNRAGECTTQALYRTAVFEKRGIVAPGKVIASMGLQAEPPLLPHWIRDWIAAESERPWPPERG